uniref:RING-type domain-containing protein n=1 Tax=Anopheles atroparvus TaxID=41427 RepID=A0AAG5D541_ANOAO
MVLLPNGDEEVSGGGELTSSASTELASEGTAAKVFIAPSPSPAPSSSASAASPSVSVEESSDSKPPSNNSTTSTTTTMTTELVIDNDVKTEGVTGGVSAVGPLSPYRPSRVTLGSVNACITCNLCKGYLIDATTIVECLHSFCHSCIIKHLHTEQYCPQCEVMINKAKPNIKPDVPLQSIVFKLVPELYENELRRRRDFYRDHPAAATLATPAQRGEDTEHLIFSPNEQISLSLEYAESELAEDNKELLRARYLLCPAIFSIGMMKKFLVNKYGISERQFCVEIMYKVKTIVLPDYYTLMDVAYIYTWKRDAPMKYFYRIRTTETNPLELPEIPLRRSPSLITALSSNKQQSKQQQQQQQQPQQQTRRSQDEDEEDDKENMHLVPLRPLVPSLGCVSESSASEAPGTGGALTARPTTTSTPTATAPGTPDVNGNRKMVTANGDSQSPATPTTVVARKNESIKLKIELNKNKYVSFLQSPQSDVPASQSSSSSSSSPVPSGGAGAGGFASPASGGRVHKSDRPDKVKRKKTDSPRTQKMQDKMNEQMLELKIRIEKIKDHGLKKSRLAPYKVELSPGISQSESKKLHSLSKSSSGGASKAKVKSPKSHSSSSPPEAPKHPIVLKIDQRSPDMATSTLKFEMKESKQPSKTPSPPPFPPSPPSPPVKRFADEKSQFLNSFQLAPIKTPAPTSTSTPSSPETKEKPVAASATVTASPPPSPPKSPGVEAKKPTPLPTLNGSPNSKSSSPPREASSTNGNGTSASSSSSLKRKAKDSSSIRSGPKKQKLSDDEIKALVEKKVAENIKSPSEHIVPPIFLKPKVPPPPPSVASPKPVSSPPLPSKRDPAKSSSEKSSKKTVPARAKCDSPRPFLFKTPPPPPPPPIVSVTNIPAVKPSQPVLPAPVPQKIVPQAPMQAPSGKTTPPATGPSKVANGSAKASSLAQAPARRPTVPTKLPTSNAINAGSNSGSTCSSSSNATTHSVASGAGGKFQKPLELKRAQSNPWVNITSPAAAASPMRDTEISKLRPEDLKKNVKVYGPPPAPTPAATTASSSTSSSVTPSTTAVSSMPKLDSGNFAVPKPKPAPKPQQPVVSSAASTVAATSSTSTTSSTTTTKTPSASATAASAGVKVRPVNYLNYALFNSKTAPAGSRTPIPSYSSSPSYSPDSPQYNPNLNISTKQFKYANPTAFSNYMQNMMNDRKPGTTSPPTPTAGSPASSPSPPHQQENLPTPKKPLPPATSNTTNSATPPASDRKRPASAISPDTTTKSAIEPPEKQPKVQSLLNKINIPSSLSITLATEEDEVARQTARKLSENDPTNNYIEIVKLPEIPISEVVFSTDTKSPPLTSKQAGSPSPPSVLSTAAIQVLPVTTATTTQAAASTVSTPTTSSSTNNGAVSAVDSYQKKFLDSITTPKKSKTTTTNATSPAVSPATKSASKPSSPAAQQPIPPRPSTPKVPATSGGASKYKNPNATVLENGNVKLHNYQDVDLLVKGFNGAGAASQRTSSGASNGGSSAASAKLMPPPPAKTAVPIAPKSSPNGGSSASSVPQRKAVSPPVSMRSPSSSSSASLNGQPKSKTPPSILPSMASMGPMFGIQMKSDANASAANTPLRRNSTSSSLNGSAYPSVPRRKITPASNTTTLVPLRSPSTGSSSAAGQPSAPSAASLSPSSAVYKPRPPTINPGDYITLHPQPSPMEQQQQQFSQFQNMLANQYAVALASFNRNPATMAQSQFYLQQLSQQHYLQQLSQRNLVACPVTIGGTMGMATDALTITAAQQRVASKQPVQPHSLTVTPIRGPNSATGSLSGKNGGGGGAGVGVGPAAKPQPRGGAGGVPGKPPGGAS